MKAGSQQLSDREIIELYKRKNEAAITETDRKYRTYLLTVAKAYLSDPLDAEECLNDTYHEIWQSIEKSSPENLKAFLAITMRRNAIDRLKHQTRKRRLPSSLTESLSELEGVLADGNDQERLLELKELSELLNAFIKQLSERRRYLFISRYYMAQNVKKIAATLRLSVSTVTKELQTIRNELKNYLAKEGYPI